MTVTISVGVDWDRDGSYSGPLATNRLTNGDFSDGATGWGFVGGILAAVVDGKLRAYRNGGTGAVFYQDTGYKTSPGDQFTISFKVANTSAADKSISVILYDNDGDTTGAASQDYTITAGAAEDTKTVVLTAGAAWGNARFHVFINTDDNLPDLRFDDFSVITTHNKDTITAFVVDVSASLGFSDELRHTADIGQAFLTLDNGDRRFSPEYTAGQLYTKLLPNTPIQVSATDGVDTWEVWTGVLKSITPQADASDKRLALLTCEDALTAYQRETIDLPIQERITAGRLCDLITSSVYRGTAATLAVVFHDQMLNNDAVQLRGYGGQFTRTYTFKTVLTPALNEVLIGATKEATAVNFADTLNNNPDSVGTAYATTTARNELLSAGDVAAGTVHAGGTTTVTASGATAELGNVSGAHKEQMQVVALTEPGLASQFKVTLGANTGTPSGTLTYYLFDGSLASSYPDWMDIKATARVTGTFTPTASAENTINLATPVYFGAKIGIWLAPTTPQATDNYWTWQRSTTDVHGSADCKLYTTSDAGHNWTSAAVDAACAVTTTATTDANLTVTALVRGAEGNSISIDDEGTIFIGGTLTGGANAPAGLISSEVGNRLFELAGDGWDQDNINAWQVLDAVVRAEFGYLWAARDGTITFKNRYWEMRLGSATPTLTINGTHTGMEGSLHDGRILNKITVSYLPKIQSGSGVVAQSFSPIEVPGRSYTSDAVAWNAKTNRGKRVYSGTASKPAGKPIPGDKTIRLPYTDTSGNRIGAKDLVAPVAGVDFTVNEAIDGSGFDYTASKRIFIALAPGGSDVEVSFKNTAMGPLYVRNFRIQGTLIRQYSPESLVVADDDSIDDYGTHPGDYALDLGTDLVFAEAIGYYLLSRYSTPVFVIDTLVFQGPEVVAGVNILSLEIGDVLAITETQTAVSGQLYIIRGMDYQLTAGGALINARFRLKRVDSPSYWILDDATYGVLGSTTRLGL